jgi:hypothetical protein
MAKTATLRDKRTPAVARRQNPNGDASAGAGQNWRRRAARCACRWRTDGAGDVTAGDAPGLFCCSYRHAVKVTCRI